MLPAASATGTADSDLLTLAHEELYGPVTAKLMEVREEYLVTYSDTTLSGTVYRISTRASAQSLREVELRDSAGSIQHLFRLRPEQVEQYNVSSGAPLAYYLRGGYLILAPGGTTSLTTLRQYFPCRPSELTATASDYGTISQINTSTGVVTFTGSGAFGSLTPIDFVSASPGFDVLAAHITPTNATATTVTVAATSLPTGLAEGDYVCLASKSPVPTIPLELHRLLILRTAMRVCLATGDFEGVDRLLGEIEQYESDELNTLLSPRTQGSAPRTVPRTTPLRPFPRGYYGGL